MKIKKVDKSLKYVNRNTMMSNKKIEKKIKKKQLEDDEETKISSWKENKMHSVLLNLKKNQ